VKIEEKKDNLSEESSEKEVKVTKVTKEIKQQQPEAGCTCVVL